MQVSSNSLTCGMNSGSLDVIPKKRKRESSLLREQREEINILRKEKKDMEGLLSQLMKRIDNLEERGDRHSTELKKEKTKKEIEKAKKRYNASLAYLKCFCPVGVTVIQKGESAVNVVAPSRVTDIINRNKKNRPYCCFFTTAACVGCTTALVPYCKKPLYNFIDYSLKTYLPKGLIGLFK